MVDQTADGCINIAGGHRAHQVEANVNHVHAVRIGTVGLHDAADQCLGKLGARVADRFALEILRLGDVLVLERQDDVQRTLNHRTDGLDRHILLSTSLNDILLIIQTNVCLAGGNHAHGIVYACRRLDIHIQTFLGEVTLLLRFVQECMQGIRIPVEHNGQVLQIIAAAVCRIRLCGVLCAAAGQQHGACCQKCKNTLFHIWFSPYVRTKISFFLKLCYQVYKLLRQVIIFFSNQLTMPTAIIATTLSSTIGANTPAPSSCVIMRRLK